MSTTTLRYAEVVGEPSSVIAYLPANYFYAGSFEDEGRHITIIAGRDNAGWTLEDYVIPRLASGLYPARELVVAP